ncbi:MAG TPA: CBS domain-containing protein [Acidimicrobiales bacterium]|jgi:CBS domain-containing protein
MTTLREVMTADPVGLPADATLVRAAEEMRDRDIGDVLVYDGDVVRGLVTDRDVVVRAVASGLDPTKTTLREIVTDGVVAMNADDGVEDAVKVMRARAVRRIPVVDTGQVVGVVSIGDLAQRQDPNSALADISGAPPNN